MKFIDSKLKSKFGPFILAGLTAVCLIVALLISSSAAQEVLAQARDGGGQAKPPATKPATSTTTKPKQPATSTTTVKNPGNLNKDTGEKIDESGRSGFVICGNTVDTPCNVTHLFRGLIIIINYMITMAGLVAILFIIIAGVQIILSQFYGGDQAKLTQAKRKLGGAVGGLVLVAVAFVLVNSLLAGSLNIGIKNGALILSNPKEYIQQDN